MPNPARTPVTIVGATGLTGSAALSCLLTSPTAFAITALTRRPAPQTPSNTSTTYTNRVGDLTKVTSKPEPIASPGSVYVTALATTRAAEGIAQQEKIDLVLNRELAQRARKDGAETIIVVSAMGANAASWFAYPRIKGQLEEDVKAMGFKSTVFIRPAVLLYEERPSAGLAERIVVNSIKGLRSLGVPTTYLGVDGADVGAAIAQIATKAPEGVTALYDHDIVALAKEFRESQQKLQKGNENK